MHGFNFTDSAEKAVCRARNIEALKGARHLVSGGIAPKLRMDWLELAGLDAPTSYELQDRQLLGDAKYIGVDIERDVISRLKADRTRKHSEFYHGDFATLLTRDRHLFSKVGVLNLDTTHGWQGDRRPPIIEDCTAATNFIISRLFPSPDSYETPAREFLFIVNGYVRKVDEVIPTMDRALAPLRAMCRKMRLPLRVANLISYPSRARNSEMINLVLAIGY